MVDLLMLPFYKNKVSTKKSVKHSSSNYQSALTLNISMIKDFLLLTTSDQLLLTASHQLQQSSIAVLPSYRKNINEPKQPKENFLLYLLS
jgi:hypothetical protein